MLLVFKNSKTDLSTTRTRNKMSLKDSYGYNKHKKCKNLNKSE